ncbi:MAG TPA: alpha/beta hydrolase [Actinomycetota bacterium]|nr:alpha/beta hydrolase [Actinomycetota bacterium]
MATSVREQVPVVFLPGILMPAALRYPPLIEALGEDVRPVLKELEVYREPTVPPPGYSMETEVAGIDRAADEAGFETFHLYGHSGGGAIALAFSASRPERVRSLAVDEPAIDFDPEDLAMIRETYLPMLELPVLEMMRAFVAEQLRSGVAPPPPPEGPPPPWMETRPAGIAALTHAFVDSDVPIERLRGFDRPAYYSYGSLSNEAWERRAERLSALMPQLVVERYEGLSHMNTSHAAEPERVARVLRRLWGLDLGAQPRAR